MVRSPATEAVDLRTSKYQPGVAVRILWTPQRLAKNRDRGPKNSLKPGQYESSRYLLGSSYEATNYQTTN